MSEPPGWSAPDQQPNQPQQPPQPPPGYYAPPPPGPQPTIKPGVIPLRPLGVGEIIDGAVTTMRRHPKIILGAAAVVAAITQIVVLLVQVPLLRDITDVVTRDQGTMTEQQVLEEFAGNLASFFTGAMISAVLAMIGTVFLSGFITVVVGHAVLGRPVTFAQAWQEFRPRLLPLLAATVLFGLAVGAAVLVFLLPSILVGDGFVIAGGLLLGLLAGVWVWVLFSLVTPALVLERCGIGVAFGRSKSLVKGAWWRTFGILLLSVLITTVISWIIGLPFNALSMATSGFGTDPAAVLSTGSVVVLAIGAIVASTITLPFKSAVNVLVYVDRRMRTEGMDIELQRAAGHGGS